MTEYTLIDFANEFDGDRAEEHRKAIEESEMAAEDSDPNE